MACAVGVSPEEQIRSLLAGFQSEGEVTVTSEDDVLSVLTSNTQDKPLTRLQL